MKKALIIVAHGSRLEPANSEVLAFVNNLKTKLSGYSEITCAFMEFTKPDLKNAIGRLAEDETKEIVIFPYFLSEGSHLQGIKKSISESEKIYKNIRFSVTAYMGALPNLGDFISDYIASTSCC